MLESVYDADWYKVAMQDGHTYAVELQGALSGNGTLAARGLGLAVADNWGYSRSVDGVYAYRDYAEPVMTYQAARSGDFYVAVDGGARAEGSYRLQVTDVTNDRKGPALVAVSHGGGARLDIFDTVTLSFDESIKVNPGGVTITGPGGEESLKSMAADGDKLLALGGKLVLDPAGRFDPGATYTLNIKPGSITDVAGNPYSGELSFTFAGRPLLATGTAGNDYLDGAATSGSLAGGAGLDTLFYNRASDYFKVTGSGNGKFSIGPRYGSTEPTVTLDSVDRVLFGHGTGIALDVEGAGGQAYRLYQAAFNRTPDIDGVGYWMAQLDKGMALTDAAHAFMAGSEFQRLYGAKPTDQAFVELLYNNVLHRMPDAGGAAYWNGMLHDDLSREQVLVYFSEGQENHDAVAKLIANGFTYFPYG